MRQVDTITQAPNIQRKLTTILAADAANVSGRMAHDEVGTIQALRRSRVIFEHSIRLRGGRIATVQINDITTVIVDTVIARDACNKREKREKQRMTQSVGFVVLLNGTNNKDTKKHHVPQDGDS